MKVLIVDDIELPRLRLLQLLTDDDFFEFAEIDVCASYGEALALLEKNKYQLSLLDIKLDDNRTCFELLEEVGRDRFGMAVITSDVESITLEHLEEYSIDRTITKPYSSKKIQSIKLFLLNTLNKEYSGVSIKNGTTTFMFDSAEIYYIEKSDKYCLFYCKPDKYVPNQRIAGIPVATTLDYLETILDTNLFKRCSNSAIVNMREIRSILSGGTRRGVIKFKNVSLSELGFTEDFWNVLESWGFVI